MDNAHRLFNCNSCKKSYSSYKSLWNHNKKFHDNINNGVNASVNGVDASVNGVNGNVNGTNGNVNGNINVKMYNCLKCNKSFASRQSRYQHENKYCKNTDISIIQNQEETIKLKEENKKLKEENIILKKSKENITNNNITNNNNNSITNNNNGTINNTYNFNINAVGNESLDKLTFKEIRQIFNQNMNCLIEALKIVNFNKNIPENHNFYNSSLEGKYVNVYNIEENKIEKRNKKDFFDVILSSSIRMIDVLGEQLRKKITNNNKTQLIKQINDVKNKYYNYRKTYHSNFNEISYNNKQLVKKTINKKINNEIITDELNQLSDSNSDNDNSDSDSDSYESNMSDSDHIQPLKMTDDNESFLKPKKYKLFYNT
jgi:hypothetical protein